jgi:hypothetical protein
MLFGSGITFYGGSGESAHKQFSKIPGQRTQQRVSEFAPSEVQNKMIIMGHQISSCRFPVVRSFFIL